LLDHGIESITWPAQQVTQTVNLDLIPPASQAGIGSLEMPPEHVRVGHPALFFLRIEPLRQSLTNGMITR